jgi:hypothetical protein
MNKAPQLEPQSCAKAEKSGYDARRARYEKSEKAKERRRRYREQVKERRREARRVTRQIRWAHRSLGVVCHSANSEAKTVPLPAVAENTRTTVWERIRTRGDGAFILPDRKLPYRAGVTFDPEEVQLHESHLRLLQQSAALRGVA